MGGAGAIRTGLVRGCVDVGRIGRAFGVDGVRFEESDVDDVATVLELAVAVVVTLAVVARSSSAIASWMARSSWEFNFRLLRIAKVVLILFI